MVIEKHKQYCIKKIKINHRSHRLFIYTFKDILYRFKDILKDFCMQKKISQTFTVSLKNVPEIQVYMIILKVNELMN